jgi:hypothetical protein
MVTHNVIQEIEEGQKEQNGTAGEAGHRALLSLLSSFAPPFFV